MVVFLVLVFAFDLANMFHTSPAPTPENASQFYSSEKERADADDQATLDANSGTNQEKHDAGWVRPLEYGILGGGVVLGGVTIAVWRGRRRAVIRDQR